MTDKTVSEERKAAIRQAVQKHDLEKVDKVTVRLPKGTKETILSTGQPVNAFVIHAVIDLLARIKGESILADPVPGNPSADPEKVDPSTGSFLKDENSDLGEGSFSADEIERVPAEEIP